MLIFSLMFVIIFYATDSSVVDQLITQSRTDRRTKVLLAEHRVNPSTT